MGLGGSHDTRLAAKAARAKHPGEVPEHRIPIFDHKGNLRGRVGPRATEVTVSRFINLPGAKLGTKDGRDAWLGPKPPPKPKPKFPKPGEGAPGAAAAPGGKPAAATHSLEISLKAAKGSNKPTPKPASKK